MSVLWTSQEAARATGGRVAGDWAASGLSIDTRSLAPGDMFIALTAARDGHDFVAHALGQGAASALVSRVPEGVDPSRLLLVADVQTALEDLARAARARTQAKVLAITGSVGKTSTKDMAAHILRAQRRTHAAEKSYNNHWGVPLTLARMPADSQFAVIEIGMNHPGEIAPLAVLARPDVAIVTTVGPVHLEAFADGVAGIAREKAAIFSGLSAGGTAIWNADLEDLSQILAQGAGARSGLSFGTGAAADWRLSDLTSAAGALACAAQTPQGRVLFKIGAPGRHFALNGLAVLAAAVALGADLAGAALSLADWTPPAGRGARRFVALDTNRPEIGIDLIDDSYNANPSSVAAGLALLAEVSPPKGGRRVAILGDMRELGRTENALHRGLAELEAVAAIDLIHTTGPLMRHLHRALPGGKRGHHGADAAALAGMILELVRPGDSVLVKGSFSMDMARVVDAIADLGQAEANRRRG